MSPSLEVIGLGGMPEVKAGDKLGELVVQALDAAGLEPAPGDVVVIAQKIVSKAEGMVRDLDELDPGERALELATELEKDPRLVELILRESRRIVRAERGILIVETHSGWICANAGVDASNVTGEGAVTLLPRDPDGSARRIRGELELACSVASAVVISDSFGRPWRLGQTDVAIGCAGLKPMDDWRGRHDGSGRELTATSIAIADEVAAAADLVRSKDAGVPVCLVRGLERFVTAEDGPGAASIRRPRGEDLFR